MLHPRFRHRTRIPIRPLQIRKIARDALLELLHPCLELVLGEVAIPAVHRFELAAIDRHQRIGKQVHVPAQQHKLPTHPPDRFAVVAAKVSDRLEVRRELAGEPDQLHVALRLAFQSAAGLQAV